jgi:uncharacterized membrane protein
MTIKTNPAVAEYLARAQAALSDLPASEVAEILEDIGPHLSEVAAELGEDVTVDGLTERLGTPEQYAAELRAAAGYPPAGQPPRRGTGLARFALWALVLSTVIALLAGLAFNELVGDAVGPAVLVNIPLFLALFLIFTGRVTPAAVAALPEYRAAAAAGRRAVAALPGNAATYLRSLRPAWWLVRVVALLAAALFAFNHGKAPQWMSAVAGLIILLWVGARARRDHRWNWLVIPANAFAAALVVVLIFGAWRGLAGSRYQPVMYDGGSIGLRNDGQLVRNVYLFGPDGKPINEAYLYDQDGRPIVLSPETCEGFGPPINRFPQPRMEFDPQARCRTVTGAPFTVAIPTTQPPAPTTTAPAQSTEPTK